MTEVTNTNTDWLETGPAATESADWLGLEIPKAKIPYDEIRFSVMRGSQRVWACDGEYVACRPAAFNPATHQRHSNFLASGCYEHVGTFDDVQVFKLLDGSPFKRNDKTFIPGQNLHQDMRQAAIAACARDWVLYHDILDAIASGLKNAFTEGFARTVFQDALAQIFVHIQQRGGPTQAEVDAGLSNVRAKRGYGNKLIAVPGIPLRR